jgi:hypothetical protein
MEPNMLRRWLLRHMFHDVLIAVTFCVAAAYFWAGASSTGLWPHGPTEWLRVFQGVGVGVLVHLARQWFRAKPTPEADEE